MDSLEEGDGITAHISAFQRGFLDSRPLPLFLFRRRHRHYCHGPNRAVFHRTHFDWTRLLPGPKFFQLLLPKSLYIGRTVRDRVLPDRPAPVPRPEIILIEETVPVMRLFGWMVYHAPRTGAWRSRQ